VGGCAEFSDPEKEPKSSAFVTKFPRAAPLVLAGCLVGCNGAIDGDPRTGATGSGQPPASSVGGSSGAGTSAGAGPAQGGGSNGNAGSTSSAGTSTGSPSAPCTPGTLAVGLTKLRRLTRDEFNHTLRDLLGVTDAPASALAPDESIGPFYSNAIAPVTDLLVQQHDEVARALALQATPNMNAVAGCDLAAGGSVCAGQFIESFGLRAYRRPLESSERNEYLTLYETELAAGTVESAFQQVLSTLLQSPFFLYHHDVGTSGVPSPTAVPLTGYELASRLSYFLWQTLPDRELFELAASDTLKDDAVLAAQVERMLLDTKAGDSIPRFHLAWLGIRDLVGLDKDTTRYPAFDVELASAMTAETARFSDFVIRQGDGLMSTLYTASFSFPEGPLFALYGLSEPPGFVPGTEVTLNGTERGGLLTQAAFLTAHAHRDSSSPVHRGIAVRENLLCQPLDPPPPGVNTTIPAPSAARTIRDVLREHEANPSCGGCHLLIDPIGLAFEHYDGIGAYRTSWTPDGSQPIDATGEILDGGDDLAGAFDGVGELSQKLAQSRTAADCLSNQWFRFALGRMESDDDACSMQAIHDSFAASGNNVRQLLASIVKSQAFRNVRSTAVTP
jgi:hypothetical protein